MKMLQHMFFFFFFLNGSSSSHDFPRIESYGQLIISTYGKNATNEQQAKEPESADSTNIIE